MNASTARGPSLGLGSSYTPYTDMIGYDVMCGRMLVMMSKMGWDRIGGMGWDRRIEEVVNVRK